MVEFETLVGNLVENLGIRSVRNSAVDSVTGIHLGFGNSFMNSGGIPSVGNVLGNSVQNSLRNLVRSGILRNWQISQQY